STWSSGRCGATDTADDPHGSPSAAPSVMVGRGSFGAVSSGTAHAAMGSLRRAGTPGRRGHWTRPAHVAGMAPETCLPPAGARLRSHRAGRGEVGSRQLAHVL